MAQETHRRKSRVRGSCGAPQITPGGLCSTMWPSSQKSRCPNLTSELHLVRPDQHGLPVFRRRGALGLPLAHPFRIERRGGSSNNIRSASSDIARPIPTRCCCPPESAAGFCLVEETGLTQDCIGPCACLVGRLAAHGDQRLGVFCRAVLSKRRRRCTAGDPEFAGGWPWAASTCLPPNDHEQAPFPVTPACETPLPRR